MHKRSPTPISPDERLTRERLVEHYHSRLKFNRTWAEALADFLTQQFGTISFLILNTVAFVAWLLWNTGVFGFPIFDKPPFILLTMIVSLEAIFLSIIVLMSQNRQGKIADVRQKLDFEIDVRAEEEITKVLMMLEELHTHLGIRHGKDGELEWMKRKVDLTELRKEAEE